MGVMKLFLPRFRPLVLGNLPHGRLARANLFLPPGPVHFSIMAQRHAFKRHPETFMSCLPFLSETVTDPTHAGQAPDHGTDGFELIREIRQANLILLVAIRIRRSSDGAYQVSSTYPIDRNKLERRLRKKFIVRL